jgi:hypothetical protein
VSEYRRKRYGYNLHSGNFVGMADAAGFDPYKDLAVFRSFQFQLFDLKRLPLFKNCRSLYLHDDSPHSRLQSVNF